MIAVISQFPGHTMVAMAGHTFRVLDIGAAATERALEWAAERGADGATIVRPDGSEFNTSFTWRGV